MPPRRSKRFKSAPQDSQELSVSSDNRTPDLDPPKAINTKGLPILPDELYLEILSYYPVSQFRQDPNHSVRRQVLFALSQTSTNLRRFFLCYLWERIEVSRSGHAPIKNRPLALELVRQLEIVTIRDPTLAKYVKVVNVDIGVYSQDSVLTELARCLALFPNLYSVQLKIEKNPSMQQGTIARPFKEYVYENIRTAIVSCNALEFLRSCPQSLYVDTCERNILPSPFWDVVTACCPRIEVAPRRNLIPISRMPGIAKALPGIRNLTLWRHQLFKPRSTEITNHAFVSALAEFKRLKVLTIGDILDEEQDMKDPPSQICGRIARKLLLDLQRTDKEDKVFVLMFRNGKRSTIQLRYREPLPV